MENNRLKKQQKFKRIKVISTIIYIILMVLLILIRFPVTIDSIRLNYSPQNVATSEVMDQKGRVVTPEFRILYDQGKGFIYDGKINGNAATVTNEIRGVAERENTILYTIYQDGDPTLFTNLNSLHVKKLRFECPDIKIESIEFLNGKRVQQVIAADVLLKYMQDKEGISDVITDDGKAVLQATSKQAWFEIDTTRNSIYYQTFYHFGFINIVMMMIFSLFYVIVAYGHDIINRLQERLLK